MLCRTRLPYNQGFVNILGKRVRGNGQRLDEVQLIIAIWLAFSVGLGWRPSGFE